jgi:hypothetical protein
MRNELGDTLAAFSEGLAGLRRKLEGYPALEGALFEGTETWVNLLTYKLVPHFAGAGCLVVAVTGGTNSGKSTLFNMLAGKELSPARVTAAATRRPLLASSTSRVAQCLRGELVPEFRPAPLDDPSQLTDVEAPEDVLYVVPAEAIGDGAALLDTPDVDSIDQQNWQVAENLRAAGDVVVAALTGEKYKDERVVGFFKRAAASGRQVIPVMNKANPANGFEVARTQLEDFAAQAELVPGAPLFAVAHDFEIGVGAPIVPLTAQNDLRQYLKDLDVPAIKRQVYRDTLAHFAAESGAFLQKAQETAHALHAAADDFEERARTAASAYEPVPGKAVAGLFHEFMQTKRGPVRRAIGQAGSGVARGAGAATRAIGRALKRRTAFEKSEEAANEEELRKREAEAVTRRARELARQYLHQAPNLPQPARSLVERGCKNLDVDQAIETIKRDTLKAKSVSEAFHDHAMETLNRWWEREPGKRRAFQAIEGVLAFAPTAIAAPIAIYNLGIGAPEAIAVLEYQLGDAMFDFLSPWREEQRDALAAALHAHITAPCLRPLRECLDALEGPPVSDLRRLHAQCRQAL